MGDEAKGNSPETSPSRCTQSFLLVRNPFPLFLGSLPENSVVVWSTGRLKLEGNLIDLFIKPVKGFLIIKSRNSLVLEFLPSPSWNQKEDVMGCCAERHCKTEDFTDQVEIGLCDGCINLKFEPPFFCHLNPPKGALKGTAHLSEGIVCLRIGAVEANADSLYPCPFHLSDGSFCDQGAIGRHDHPKTFARPIEGQVEDIGSEEWLTSG
jgi:hypothetical protein